MIGYILLLLLVVFGSRFPLRARKSRNSRTVTHPACGHCGYDVRGLPTFICPECGKDLREAGILTPGALRPPMPGSLEARLMKPLPQWVGWAVFILVVGMLVLFRVVFL